MAGDVVTAGAAGSDVAQAAGGQPEQGETELPADQGAVTQDEAAPGAVGAAAAETAASPPSRAAVRRANAAAAASSAGPNGTAGTAAVRRRPPAGQGTGSASSRTSPADQSICGDGGSA